MNRASKGANKSNRADECFSLNLDDEHSKSLIREIERIISGECLDEDDEEHLATREAPTTGRKGESDKAIQITYSQ